MRFCAHPLITIDITRYRFLRIRELEKLKKDAKDKLDALVSKSEEIEEYEEDVEVEEEQKTVNNEETETNGTPKKGASDNKEDDGNDNNTESKPLIDSEDNDTNKDNNEEDKDKDKDKESDKTETVEMNGKSKEEENNDDENKKNEDKDNITSNTEERTPLNREENNKPKTIKKVKKTRQRVLSDKENEMIAELSAALTNYDGELKVMLDESVKYYEIASYNDYAIDKYEYCGALGEKSRDESWFRVQNINYWGKIGGFATILKRISHAKCAVAVSDLVNLIRPVAQVFGSLIY